ncbi:MAG: cell division protein [Proteobacteria bacterium]|nr:MAG: cell division protein [Pseudomonadota bacterium]
MRNPVNPALGLRLPPARARVLVGMLILCFGTLTARAMYLQVWHNDFLQQEGASRFTRLLELPAHRGMIIDRNGEPLAISTPVESVWASPSDVDISPTQRRRLATLLQLDDAELKRKLGESGKEFVYLRRQLPPEVAAKVVQLGLPGIFLKREYRRYYPAGEITAHLVGLTDVDDRGQEGLELEYQDWLAGKPGSRRVVKDRLGHIVEDAEGIHPPVEGRDLMLSIDRRLQYLAYRELKAAVIEHRAKAGGIVVLDVKTGELLALANLPAFNPNNRATLDARRARNRAITDVFEPGSTLKPFTVAAALEAGAVRSNTLLQIAPGYLTVGDATIHDAHPEGALTVAQVIQKSSNVGAAKIALSLPREALWKMLSAAGFGAPPQLGFPGEVGGRLRAYQHWRPIEQATLAYGHGISVSLLQLAHAYTIFATDGVLQPMTLVKREERVEGTRVLSAGTARDIRGMLELVVKPGGTAPRARIVGYRVAGKTGTAHKLDGKGYAQDRYVSSFVGIAPASAPRLLVAVMLDEPGDGEYYGGVVAGPVFSRVMAEALRMLSIGPDAPIVDNIPLESLPEIREEV